MEKRIRIIKKNNLEPTQDISDFEKTGVSTFKVNINIKVTQQDMEKDLVKRTEGTFIKPKLDENNN